MGGMVTIFDPDGNKGEIPQERLVDAVKAGAKPAVTMKAPDGSLGDIPADRIQEAVKAGASIVPLEAQENQHAGFWHSLWSDIAGMAPGVGTIARAAASQNPAELAQGTVEQGKSIGQNYQERKAAGNSLPYRLGAAANEALGVNVKGEEEAAKSGDVGGVLGHAAAVPAVIAATEGVTRGVSAARDALPSRVRAGAALQDVKGTAGSVPIDTAKVGDSALELYTQSQRGATLPPAVNKLVRRLTQPGGEPMTYAEAKDFQSNISNLSANEKMNLKPNQVRLVGQLNADLKASLEGAADTVGKGEQFVNAMKEYHNAMKLRGYSDNAISTAWKVALGALGAHEAAKIFGIGQR